MPRLKKKVHSALPKREQEICARLREVRDGLKLTQSEFAWQISIPRERLASYEDARAPLKLEMALKICQQFVVSEKWLAEGIKFQNRPGEEVSFSNRMARLCMGLIEDDVVKSANRTGLFSDLYDSFLSSRYEKYFKETGSRPRIWFSSPNIPAVKNLLSFLIEDWVSDLDLEEQSRVLFSLICAGEILRQEQIERTKESPKTTQFAEVVFDIFSYYDAFAWEGVSHLVKLAKKSALTNASLKSNTHDVKPLLPKLIQQVKQKASKPGAKAELARALDVAPARVTEWLSGKKEPGGEYTLRLLKWVRQS